MNKIDFSKLKVPRQAISEHISKELISVQPIPGDIIKDVLAALREEESKSKSKAENGS